MKLSLSPLKAYWMPLAIIILGISLVFASTRCTEYKLTANYQAGNVAALKDSITKTVNEFGDTIYSQRQIIVKDKAQLNDFAWQVAGLKDLVSQTQVKTTTTVKNVYIPIEKPVYYRDTTGTYLKVPALFKTTNRWYVINGTIQDSGRVTMNEISFYNEPTVSIGYKDKKWYQVFKKDELTAAYSDKNPYSRTTKLTSVTLPPARAKHIGIGVQVGYGFQRGITPAPYIGIGASYNFISF